MSIPIYASKSHNVNFDNGNKGLFFERLFDQYKIETNSVDISESTKTTFLANIKKLKNNHSDLSAIITRQMTLASSIGGDGRVYRLDGHFVTGMGNSHPVENGFLWHYSLGMPYLSGSQLKGLVRSGIEQYYQGEDKASLLFKWFGSEDKDPKNWTQRISNNDSQAGELIFFDALPYRREPVVTVDIMTPHMGNWYSDGLNIKDISRDSDKLPADWHDPVPIPFLAVKDAEFLFTIGKRPNSDIDIAEVFECLNHVLTYMGAGAKSQTGYGFMIFEEKQTRYLNEYVDNILKEAQAKKKLERAKENTSPLMADLLDEIAKNKWEMVNDSVKSNFTEALEMWLQRLEKESDKDCALRLLDIAKIHYEKQIGDPNNKNVKCRQKKWILRLLALVED